MKIIHRFLPAPAAALVLFGCASDSGERTSPVQLPHVQTPVFAAPVVMELEALLAKPCPDRNPPAVEQWKEHSQWLVSVRQRLADVYDDYEEQCNTDPRAMELPPITAYGPFIDLQNAFQMEARQFNSMSNALKARHDEAMSSIRNSK